jgi:hypothetical protein
VGGLDLQIRLRGSGQTRVADIAISGLPGWLTVSVPNGRGSVHLAVWAPAGVEVFTRPPMPVWDASPARDPASRGSEGAARPSDLDTLQWDSMYEEQEPVYRRNSRRDQRETRQGAGSKSWYEGPVSVPGDTGRVSGRPSRNSPSSRSQSPLDLLEWDDI